MDRRIIRAFAAFDVSLHHAVCLVATRRLRESTLMTDCLFVESRRPEPTWLYRKLTT